MAEIGNINGKRIFGTPTGVKITSKGRVQHPGDLLKTLSKSERRKLRKRARLAGLLHIASA